MATGSTAEQEIEILLMEWRAMLDTWREHEQGPLDFSFFDIRMFLFLIPSHFFMLTYVCKFLLWSKICPIVNNPPCLR
jgi:hypothetical protein